MRSRVVIVIVSILLVAGGTALLVWQRSEREIEPAKPESDPAEGFEPRRTRAELEKGIAEARAERERLVGSPAATSNDPGLAEAQEMKRKAEAAQSPSAAEAEANARLAEIEAELASAADAKERERLERQKRLVEEVLAKLKKM